MIPNDKDDETNTPSHTVLSMISGVLTTSSGIHGAHFGAGIKIRYSASDAKRQTIPWENVRMAGQVQ